jgi:hypothetical protein
MAKRDGEAWWWRAIRRWVATLGLRRGLLRPSGAPKVPSVDAQWRSAAAKRGVEARRRRAVTLQAGEARWRSAGGEARSLRRGRDA